MYISNIVSLLYFSDLMGGNFFTVIEIFGLTVGRWDRNDQAKTIGANFIPFHRQLRTLRFCYNQAKGCRLQVDIQIVFQINHCYKYIYFRSLQLYHDLCQFL